MARKAPSFTVRRVTPELWPALEELFGRKGASNGCWCMYWRIGSEYHKRPREQNKEELQRIVAHGPPPGLIAFDGDVPAGWCQLTPRSDLAWLNRLRELAPSDDEAVWSISCFYVLPAYRKRGVTDALIAKAITEARKAKVFAVEAYPIDTAQPGSSKNTFTGTAATFKRAGFRTVTRRAPARPVMRYVFK